MNLPNKITMVRMGLIPFFVASYLYLTPNSVIPALLFIIASVTDFLDGHIARSRHLVTTFGKFMDPLADKALTLSAFILLVGGGQIASWVVVIIVVRELMITGFRTIAVSNGVTIAASIWGKYKTTFQMLAIIVLLMENNWLSFLRLFPVANVLVALAVIFTILSGVDYLWKNREILDLQNM
ncbi:CDP-diacylglycerol--glycerol-3-phosphate 3-phosphatidyltransferase [Levyella massiliensis]|uniref:CDP-diacylglycerol--glycerol-3-phosphate 3-phosphatidyltransferase n=1 Tax=Levyella massiliensis TaxID=938289 RepID=UPI0023F56AAF|nr:CDP-diacylglycerol--glycerol-3-phosphate 3-phosphatidyltransferase [Levyella massiliensis]